MGNVCDRHRNVCSKTCTKLASCLGSPRVYPPSLETLLLSMRFTGIDSDYNHKNSLPQRNNY